MKHSEILTEIQSALEEMFDLAPSRTVETAHLRDDLDLDSIDAIDLAVRLKKIIGKRIELSVLQELKTVGDVVALLEKELQKKTA